MPATRATVAVALLCLGAPAAAAAAAPSWSVRTVASDGPAFSRGIDVLPGGRVATLLELGASGQQALELRVGTQRTVLARSPHGFGPVEIKHDARGRLTVIWSTISTRRGTRRLFAWTDGRTQTISRGAASVNVASFAEASDGAAVLAYYQQDHVRVARRAPDAAAFEAPQDLTPDPGAADLPVTAVAPGGDAVVAFGDVAVRAPGAAQPFGQRQRFAIDGTRSGESRVAIDDQGTAVLAFRTIGGDGAGSTQSSVRAATWSADAPAPNASALLSRTPRAGVPVAVATGDQVVVAFKEAADATSQATLRSVVLRSDGSSVTSTGAFRGAVAGPVTATRSGTGLRVFGRDRSAISAVRVDVSARLSAPEVVARDPHVFVVDPAEAGGRAVALWTTRFAPTNAAWRVRIAVRAAPTG